MYEVLNKELDNTHTKMASCLPTLGLRFNLSTTLQWKLEDNYPRPLESPPHYLKLRGF